MNRQTFVTAKPRLRAISLPVESMRPLKTTAFASVVLVSSLFPVNLSAQTPAQSSVPTQASLMTRTYYDGAETIGRVGQVAILRRDVLHQIKKVAHLQYLSEIEKLPEEERDAHRKEYKEGLLNGYLNSDQVYSQVLDEHIRKLLFYNDYVVSRPKEQVKEQTTQLEKEFDSKYVPELEKQFHCKNLKELEDYFENEIQTDFSQEKRIFIQQTLGELWMNYNLGEEDFNPTLTELRRSYDANLDKYRVPTRIRWQSMTVYYGTRRTKEDAWRKIVHMGNAVQEVDPSKQEARFAEVCRVDSEDAFAKEGGYRESSQEGMLKSEKVEDAVFSSSLRPGELSQIIDDLSSFTIVRIISREKSKIRPFSEVQEEVRENLIAERTEAMKKKYEERLSERFSIEIYALTKEEREQVFRSANREELSATGRKTYY